MPSPDQNADDGRLVCLGEALVDLICPDRIASLSEARRFEVHFGGALANVAVAAARAGAPTALAGGCGADEWGELLRSRLTEEGVDISFYPALEGIDTPFAFASFDHDGEVHFAIHDSGIDEGVGSLAGRESELLEGAQGLVFGSNTLVGSRSRAVSRAAAGHARGAGVPVMFDPNLRPRRWADLDLARRVCLEFAIDVDLIKCNAAEARWLLGDDGAAAEEAADRLLELGPSQVVVTDGAEPAWARGIHSGSATPPPTEVVSQLGAGDAFMGVLAATIADGGLESDVIANGLRRAVRAGAEACTYLGALQ